MNSLRMLTDFVTTLEERKISYRLEHNREDSIMVIIAIPGERWEAEFFGDGHVELEVFRSQSAGLETPTVEELLARLQEK
jgi:hypothetical protein